MMHLTLLHAPNLGVHVIFIVEAIFIFGLSSFWEVGRSKHFFVLRVGIILFGGDFFGGSVIFLNFKSECGTAQLSLSILPHSTPSWILS